MNTNMNTNVNTNMNTNMNAGINTRPAIKTKMMITTAMFAALTCAATFAVKIPTPATGGYIHPGDAVVILSGVMLGPVYGVLAAGIGSMMADLLGGYLLYAPITFLIKGMIAFLCGVVYQRMKKTGRMHHLAVGIGGMLDMFLVAGGYFFFESFIYGLAAAWMSVPANLIQGASGLVIALALYPILHAVPGMKV